MQICTRHARLEMKPLAVELLHLSLDAASFRVPCLPQVFRQNKRADDVHDIIGFRIIVAPKRPGTRASSATGGAGRTETATGGKTAEERENAGTRKRPGDAGRRVGPRPARSVFTVKTFPPPYRDADSRLLHDVYEVLVGLFEEVPGRFKVGSRVDIPVLVSRFAVWILRTCLTRSWHGQKVAVGVGRDRG